MKLNIAFLKKKNYPASYNFRSIYTKLKGIYTVSECVDMNMGKFDMFT